MFASGKAFHAVYCTVGCSCMRRNQDGVQKNRLIYGMFIKWNGGWRYYEEEIQIFQKSGCGTKSSNDEKIAAIETLRGQFTVYALCRTLKILRSTFYQRKRGSDKTWFDAKNEVLRPAFKPILMKARSDSAHQKSQSNFGRMDLWSLKSTFQH